MASNWIFVMTGSNTDFCTRIKSGKWPIFRSTGNRKKLKIGDNVVFYLGGYNNKKIMGTAMISSDLEIHGGEFLIGLSDVYILDKPIIIYSVLESLTFIHNKQNWGACMQRGLILLLDEDYDVIIKKIKK